MFAARVADWVDYALRQRVRRLLAEDQLPRTEALRSWVERGTGQPCAVCGAEIEPKEYEVELEFTAEITGSVTSSATGRVTRYGTLSPSPT